METYRTGGMTAIAVLNVILGGIEILNGLFLLLGALSLMAELLRLGAFHIQIARWVQSPDFGDGSVGLVAGTGISDCARGRAIEPCLRWTAVPFVCAFLPYRPCYATIGSYDMGSISTDALVRLIICGAIYVGFHSLFCSFVRRFLQACMEGRLRKRRAGIVQRVGGWSAPKPHQLLWGRAITGFASRDPSYTWRARYFSGRKTSATASCSGTSGNRLSRWQ